MTVSGTEPSTRAAGGEALVGVALLNFGEPEELSPEAVTDYLERIFSANASLEGDLAPEEASRRSRQLAQRRTEGLLEEYREIGGSPLNRQARRQAERLEVELEERGHGARCRPAMQFTAPRIPDVVDELREAGARVLVGLPVYPLSGRSTNVAALEELDAAVADSRWDVRRAHVNGWHRHPGYLELRARNVGRHCQAQGVDLTDPGTRLLFSAHGTPLRYLEEGNRYREYVKEYCRSLARRLGGVAYALGYQNHRNRGVAWTEPDVEEVVRELEGERVVVEPVSFMHEQSETLAELDDDLCQEARDAGLDFHRVPVPWDDAGFPGVLADLVEEVLAAGTTPGTDLAPCRCREDAATWCLNARPRASARRESAPPRQHG